MTAQSGVGRHQEERKTLAWKWKGRIRERQKNGRLSTCQLTYIGNNGRRRKVALLTCVQQASISHDFPVYFLWHKCQNNTSKHTLSSFIPFPPNSPFIITYLNSKLLQIEENYAHYSGISCVIQAQHINSRPSLCPSLFTKHPMQKKKKIWQFKSNSGVLYETGHIPETHFTGSLTLTLSGP
jgi:hypothetical protein